MKLKEMIAIGRVLYGDEDISAPLEGWQQHLAEVLTQGINTAYQTLARERCPLYTQEEIVLPEEGFETASFRLPFLGLQEALVNGKKVRAYCEKGRIYAGFPGGTLPAGTRLTVCYRYLPPPLSGPEDAPLIPEAEIDHRAFVYFALSLYCGAQRRFSDAQNWDWRYRSLLEAHPVPAKGRMPVKKDVFGRWGR